MPFLRTAGSESSPSRITTLPPSDTWENRTARSTTRWGRRGAVISVAGELDASNVGHLAEYLQRAANFCEWLVLDLSDLDFIGTEGFSSLNSLVDRCAASHRYCAIIPGLAVDRLLRVCDPAHILPTAPSLPDALARVQVFRKAR